MKVCSLFCGIGGIDLMFEKAGHSVVWANDIDKYACMTYRRNFPHVPLTEGDIGNVNKGDLPDFDVLAAGFPCQPFSVCGKQKGFADPRGNIFFEIGKIMDAKNPSVVFLENVANLTEHDGGKTFDVIHKELAGRDYVIRYLVADACEYFNIPQHRTRTYVFAFRDEELSKRFSFPDKKRLQKRIKDVIDTSLKVADMFYLTPNDRGYGELLSVAEYGQLYRFSDYGLQSGKDGIAFTLKANMGTYPNRIPFIKDDYGIRRITPHECLALQGFPSDFVFPPEVPLRERYKQAGNTVCIGDIIREDCFD